MSVDVKNNKKRKSLDSNVSVTAAKKVKTTSITRKSAERPAPLKSALKKSSTTTTTTTNATSPQKQDLGVVLKEKPKSTEVKGNAKKAAKSGTKAVKDRNAKTTKEKSSPTQREDADKEDNADDNEPSAAALTAEQTAALLAGFSSDEDEEDDNDQADAGIDISTLPAPPASAKSKSSQALTGTPASDPESSPGTIYMSRLPHGFYERQLHAYLSQFGAIKNLRLARNPRTGKSRHHAFVQFASAAVAEIVAKTMDKYLLFGHILQVKTVPPEQVGENMFQRKGRRIGTNGRVAPRNRIEGGKLKRGMEREKWEKRIEREEKRREQKMAALKEMGYVFDLPDLKKVEAVPRKEKEVEAGKEVVMANGNAVENMSEKLAAGGTPVVEGTISETLQIMPASEADGVKKLVLEKKVRRKSRGSDGQDLKKVKKVSKA